MTVFTVSWGHTLTPVVWTVDLLTRCLSCSARTLVACLMGREASRKWRYFMSLSPGKFMSCISAGQEREREREKRLESFNKHRIFTANIITNFFIISDYNFTGCHVYVKYLWITGIITNKQNAQFQLHAQQCCAKSFQEHFFYLLERSFFFLDVGLPIIIC